MTLKDVAMLSGCSVATVSKAFKNSPEVSEETKKRIIAAAKQCGYIKKATTRSAVLGGHKLVIFADSNGEYSGRFNEIARLGKSLNISVFYLMETYEKSAEIMEQTGALGMVTVEGADPDNEKIFEFDGNFGNLKSIFNKILDIAPKRPSRSKEGIIKTATRKTADSGKETGGKDEIWLL